MTDDTLQSNKLSSGVCYYIDGDQQRGRLYRSYKSLIRKYSGPVSVIFKNTLVDDSIVDCQLIEDKRVVPLGHIKYSPIWYQKASAHEYLYPYDVNAVFDLDTRIVKPLPTDLFDISQVRIMKDRRADGGCVVLRRADGIVDKWLEFIRICWRMRREGTRNLADERSLTWLWKKDYLEKIKDDTFIVHNRRDAEQWKH